MPGRSEPVDATGEALLRSVLAAAGLPVSGRFVERAGWVSRAWVGDDFVVRVSRGQAAADAFAHAARVADLLTDSDVPHARHIASGRVPEGAWSVSERLAGRTLHEVWPSADDRTRRSIIASLGGALQALHRVSVPDGLLPPWLVDALSGGPWPAYHPPVVGEALRQVEAARQAPDRDADVLDDVEAWLHERLPLFSADRAVLVHGDLHGSNVMVEGGRVTGLIDFAEALAQPPDLELDTILRWCARPSEFPPTPGARGLSRSTLTVVPRWLRDAYPALFERPHLRERLDVYDMVVELAIVAHHPDSEVRAGARRRAVRLLAGRNHLDEVVPT